MRKTWASLGAWSLAILASAAAAGKPEVWRHETAKDFLTGERSRLVVGNDGKLQLACRIERVAKFEAAHLWSVTSSKAGDLLIATGNPGSVCRVQIDGKSTTLLTDEKRQFFAVASDRGGNVYAASSPNGGIWKIDAAGKSSQLSKPGATYVWALATDTAGNVYAATGTPARILKYDAAGNQSVICAPKVPHIVSLLIDANGTVYAGAAGRGLVYRIEPGKSPFVLFEAPQSDIKSLCMDARGNLFVGTATATRGSVASSGRGYDSGMDLTSTVKSIEGPVAVSLAAGTVAPSTSKAKASRDDGPIEPASFTTPPGTGENSVYRIRPFGAVDEVFREKANLAGLAVVGDRLLVSAANESRLFEVDLRSNAAWEWARLEHGQLGPLCQQSDATYCIASNASAVYRLAREFVAEGEWTSAVRDAKLPARWGRATSFVDVPSGSRSKVEFRCGNVAKPDETWSAWVADSSTLPTARYCQYRVCLTSLDGAATPRVTGIHLPYATLNRPPAVDSLESPDFDKTPAAGPVGKIKIKWKASDPNQDTLCFSVAVRKDGWPDWVVVARDLTTSECEWDTATAPAGTYRIRVEASDRPSNVANEALMASRIGEPFVLDRAPPLVRLSAAKVVDQVIQLSATADDGQSRIAMAAYSLDGKAWVPIFADSGIFDSPTAKMIVRTERLEVGTHLILVRAMDVAGNVGIADAVVAVGDLSGSAKAN